MLDPRLDALYQYIKLANIEYINISSFEELDKIKTKESE